MSDTKRKTNDMVSTLENSTLAIKMQRIEHQSNEPHVSDLAKVYESCADVEEEPTSPKVFSVASRNNLSLYQRNSEGII